MQTKLRRAQFRHKAKTLVVRTGLLSLGVAFELASALSKQVQDEISYWSDGLVVAIGVLPDGPTISLRKTARNRVKYLGWKTKNPDVAILFKNVDCALTVFLGQMGTPQAAAERRFITHGAIADTQRVARTLAIVQAFLFPGFVVRATYRRPPKMGPAELSIKAAIALALLPRLAVRAFKK